jgi:N-acyl-D-amino-acid deacylase
MGNCGLGFAPVRPAQRKYVIEVMEGVEDIPGTAQSEGMTWDWESFPEYLDSLERRQRSIDVAAQVPHCALRCYVMGRDRALDVDATQEDIQWMARLTKEAIKAGAVGFSTSRTFIHRTKAGELIPGTHCHPQELLGIAQGMADAGSGVFQMISDNLGKEPDLRWMKEIAKLTGEPLIFSLMDINSANDPFEFRRTLASLKSIYETEGIDVRAAVPWQDS